MLHGLHHTSAKKVRVSSDKLKQDKIIDDADNSTHTTDDAVFFKVMIEASPLPRAWLGKGRIGSLGAAG